MKGRRRGQALRPHGPQRRGQQGTNLVFRTQTIPLGGVHIQPKIWLKQQRTQRQAQQVVRMGMA